ncbi:hypothetical protein SNEBB_003755 [Seison nebaliae]|nr:hypothetical protein SNEBB_003755 [Seison nebaliae]
MINSFEIPTLGKEVEKRPDDGGHLGRSIYLKANWFEMDISSTIPVAQYDVKFILAENRVKAENRPRQKGRNIRQEEVLSKEIDLQYRQQCMRQLEKIFEEVGPIAYDGLAIAYIRCDRISDDYSMTFDDENGKKDYYRLVLSRTKLPIIYLDKLNLAVEQTRCPELPATMQAAHIINQTMLAQFLKQYKNFFVDMTNRPTEIGEGKVKYTGVRTSLRFGTKRWFQNIDIPSAIFYEAIPLEAYLHKHYGTHPRQLKKMSNDIDGIKVKVSHTKHTRRISGIELYKRAGNITFKMSDGNRTKMMSICQYFQETYQIRIDEKELCVTIGRGPRRTFIPLKLCTIVPGCKSKGTLTAQQTASVIRESAKPAHVRLQMIEDYVGRLKERNDIYRHFGFAYSPEMTQVKGRILPPPILLDGDNKQIPTNNGKYDFNRRPFRRIETEYIKSLKWGIFSINSPMSRPTNRPLNLGQIADDVRKGSETVRIPIPFPDERFMRTINVNDLQGHFQEAKDQRVQFLMIILPESSVYCQVKTVCEIFIGIMTQCIAVKNVSKLKKPPFILNVFLKINHKLKGFNIAIDKMLTTEPFNQESVVIVIGADVTHPPANFQQPKGRGPPTLSYSIAGVVGSTNLFQTRYAARLLKQERPKKGAVENIRNIDAAVHDLLMEFYNKTNRQPTHILYYRDGVSEGQYDMILSEELRGIRNACVTLSDSYQPEMAIIVVTKRHHTRLFPTNRQDAVGQSGNVPCGTIVDSEIVDPLAFDFYLCSHEGIQGTSKPAHYIVLYDDIGFTSDTIQTLSYALCFVYGRCTRSVSIPAPVYYSHLAAFRGRAYHDSNRNIPIGKKDVIDVHDHIKNEMYFI